MKKIYFAIALIAASFCLSSVPSFAADGDGDEDSGVSLQKYVTPNGDGTYTITLEAFATGASIRTITETHEPVDIVLVLDVSGSMDNNLTSYTYTSRTSQAYSYNGYGSSTYYYKDGDGYYQVTGTTGSLLSYTARTSQSYTYDGLNNTHYYYLYNGQYYLVDRERSGGIGNRRYHMYFSVGNQKYYLYGNNGAPTTTRADTVKRSDETIWTGVLYNQTNTTTYRLQYTKDGATYYLTADGPTTTVPTNITAGGTDIWTGVLYTRTNAGTTSRLKALQEAVGDFIDVIANDAQTYNVDHKIGVVKYASDEYYNNSESSIAEGNHKDRNGYNYTEVVKQLKDVSVAGNVSGLKTAVNGLTSGGATASDYGLKKALYALGTKVSGRQQIVVMFTDGEPNHSNGFSTTVANSAITNSLALKNNGVMVYTVGVFSESGLTNNVRNYMNGVSSNYPNARAINDLGTRVSDEKNYFMNASNAGELSDIFRTIADESSTGGSSMTLGSETTTVVDVLTADFTLPAGADISRIGLFVDEVTGYDATTEKYSFGNRSNLVPSGAQRSDYVTIADATTTSGEATKKIVVTGFDFTKQDTPANGTDPILYGNWVGPRETVEGGVTTTVYKGKRLVITIPIEPAPDYQGGYSLPTNDKDGSGIFSGDEKIDDFPVPDLDFPSIGIIKNGLVKGESATFNVKLIHDIIYDENNEPQEVDGNPQIPFEMNIILTNDGSGKIPYAILKNISEGVYQVSESNWSWTYDVTEVTVSDGGSVSTGNDASVQTQVLTKAQTSDWPTGIDENVKCVLFNFTNAKNSAYDSEEEHSIYSEAVVKNKFKGGSVTNTANQTIQSKE